MVITHHACQRFRERVQPGCDDREALRLLIAASAVAKQTEQRTHLGHVVWEVEDPPMRLVTKHDERGGGAGRDLLVCVTVLAPDEPVDDDLYEEAVRVGRELIKREESALKRSSWLTATDTTPERAEAIMRRIREANEVWLSKQKRHVNRMQQIALSEAASAARVKKGRAPKVRHLQAVRDADVRSVAADARWLREYLRKVMPTHQIEKLIRGATWPTSIEEVELWTSRP